MDRRVPMVDLAMGLSNTVDLGHPAFLDHHKRVAFVAYFLGRELGMSPARAAWLLMAGLLHDLGALRVRERLDLMEFEAGMTGGRDDHAELGYQFLQRYAPLEPLASTIRWHHLPWEERPARLDSGDDVPTAANVLFIADRIAVLIDDDRPILTQVDGIREAMGAYRGTLFDPETLGAFESLSQREYFWFELTDRSLYDNLLQLGAPVAVELDGEDLAGLGRLLCDVVDFKSHYTATHSSGVAASARSLAVVRGMDGDDVTRVEVAATLHDIGKLSVPDAVLEKPGSLDEAEFGVIKGHAYHTHKLLSGIEALEDIEPLASRHHERLDGSGYPFRHEGEALPEGARVIAVADVFTALAEERPYRGPMDLDDAMDLLHEMAAQSVLDPDVVDTLTRHLGDVDEARRDGQNGAATRYRRLLTAT